MTNLIKDLSSQYDIFLAYNYVAQANSSTIIFFQNNIFTLNWLKIPFVFKKMPFCFFIRKLKMSSIIKVLLICFGEYSLCPCLVHVIVMWLSCDVMNICDCLSFEIMKMLLLVLLWCVTKILIIFMVMWSSYAF